MITIGLGCNCNCSLRSQKSNGKEVTQDGNLSKLVLGAIAKFKKIKWVRKVGSKEGSSK